MLSQTKEERKKTKITKVRNERGDITTELTEIKKNYKRML